MIEPRKEWVPEPTWYSERKAVSVVLKWPGTSGPAASKSRAGMQGSPRNLGGLIFSTEHGHGAGAVEEKVRAPDVVALTARGAKRRSAEVVVLSEGNEVRREGR